MNNLHFFNKKFSNCTWDNFSDLFLNVVKFFIVYFIILNIWRLIDIFALSSFWVENTLKDLPLALYFGGRISLKSAGAISLLYFLWAMPFALFWRKFQAKARVLFSIFAIFLTNVLGVASIFYYRDFHTNFNENVFNAVNDDLYALFKTFVEEYHLVEFLIGLFIISIILGIIIEKIISRRFFKIKINFSIVKRLHPYVLRVISIVVASIFILLIRFGGSFNYAHSIHFENAAKTSDLLLNEMILDSWQGLYRGYAIKSRISKGDILGVEVNNLPEFISYMARQNDSLKLPDYDPNNIESSLRYLSKGAKIEKPQQIFIIIGESLPQWPLLPEYGNLDLMPHLKNLEEKSNTSVNRRFMPNGAFTPMAVNAVVTGLSDVNIYPNHQIESYKSIYATGFAPQLKKLGYRVEFWYSGFSGWERIEDFTLNQGFDSFHSASDFSYKTGNVWGADDEFTFEHLFNEVEKNKDTPTAYVILTVSNHAPYSVDLNRVGFPREKIVSNLPQDVQNDTEKINKLGHIWYTDKVIGEFIDKVENANISSLFIITGDHANRVNIEQNPTSYHRYAIPFIVHGKGVEKNTISNDVAAGQIDITATLIELISNENTIYYSLGKSLTRGENVGFNDVYYLTSHDEGFIDQLENGEIKENIFAKRTISWYRTMKGNFIK